MDEVIGFCLLGVYLIVFLGLFIYRYWNVYKLRKVKRQLIYEHELNNFINDVWTSWNTVFKYYELTERQINKVLPYLEAHDWLNLSTQTYISEVFIREHANEMKWQFVRYELLSYDFIREMQRYVDWDALRKARRKRKDKKRILKEFRSYIEP